MARHTFIVQITYYDRRVELMAGDMLKATENTILPMLIQHALIKALKSVSDGKAPEVKVLMSEREQE